MRNTLQASILVKHSHHGTRILAGTMIILIGYPATDKLLVPFCATQMQSKCVFEIHNGLHNDDSWTRLGSLQVQRQMRTCSVLEKGEGK